MSNAKIILVEDHLVVARVMKSLIQTTGVKAEELVHVSDLVAFENALQAHRFVLAILDGRFPGSQEEGPKFNAHKAYDLFRASSSGYGEDGKETPVILHTLGDESVALNNMGDRSIIYLDKAHKDSTAILIAEIKRCAKIS